MNNRYKATISILLLVCLFASGCQILDDIKAAIVGKKGTKALKFVVIYPAILDGTNIIFDTDSAKYDTALKDGVTEADNKYTAIYYKSSKDDRLFYKAYPPLDQTYKVIEHCKNELKPFREQYGENCVAMIYGFSVKREYATSAQVKMFLYDIEMDSFTSVKSVIDHSTDRRFEESLAKLVRDLVIKQYK